MSDLFHKHIDRSFVNQIFDVMERSDWHIFQLLTKRSSRLQSYISERYRRSAAPDHIWLGVSVEDDARKSRIRHLQNAPATVRFLSLEPLLGPLGKLDLAGISWVIVGGESGPGHRPIDADWVREIRDQCVPNGIAFFFKQWGGFRPKSLGRTLDGVEWNEFPSRHGTTDRTVA